MNRFRSNHRRRSGDRRGAVMIVVLSLLVLFTLIGVTFVIIASRYRRAAEAVGRSELKGTDPRDLLDSAMYPLVRGTRNPNSAAMGNDLLSDFYGEESIRGGVTPNTAQIDTNAFGGQFISFRFTAGTGRNFSPIAGYYNGCVFTFLDGPGRGFSTRVVGYNPDSNADPTVATAGTINIESFVVHTGTLSSSDLAGARFVINGLPFNGTGLGFEPTTGNLDAVDYLVGPDRAWGVAGSDDDGNGIVDDPLEAGAGDDIPVAVVLMPNLSMHSQSGVTSRPLIGKSDESYDAVDMQNMLLAMVASNRSGGQQIIPSLHRPSLLNFWWRQYDKPPTPPTTLTTNFQEITGMAFPGSLRGNPPSNAEQANARQLLRRVTYRPLPFDHPNFTGSNLRLDLNTATDIQILSRLSDTSPANWDVDNDGDGIRDSIWVDLGMPAITDQSGRRYKPLFAILCRDMDGRLNLNAHGTLAHVDYDEDRAANLNNVQPNTLEDLHQEPFTGPHAVSLGTAPNDTTQTNMPRGRGYGPAEIYLRHLFSTSGNELEYLALLQGRDSGAGFVPGRYGAENLTDIRNNLPGLGRVNDPMSVLQSFRVPSNYYLVPSAYGSPPDVLGSDVISLDFNGQPFTFALATGTLGQQAEDDPYEIDLSRSGDGANSIDDEPFTYFELERLLRHYDVDAQQLPSRLYELAGNTLSQNRQLVTVDSRHVPVANAGLFYEIRQAMADGSIPAELVAMFARRGADNAWGTAGDDDGDGNPDNIEEIFWQNSDDEFAPSVLGLYAAKLWAGGVAVADINNELAKVVPPEILKGGLLNVNRPFGNGKDDNVPGGNGVINEPTIAETSNESPAWGNADNSALPPGYSASPGNSFDHVNSDPVLEAFTSLQLDNTTMPTVDQVRRLHARQIFARHLYCLMMLLVQEGFEFPLAPTEQLDSDPRRDRGVDELTAQRIAQWAVNVADFRDQDSIMTPFEYDVNPFDGWDVDGVVGFGSPDDDPAFVVKQARPPEPQKLSSEVRRVVWGCEAPVLLLEETLAFHDRRVKDTDQDTTGEERVDDSANPREEEDDDLDQIRIPQGSLFIKLYSPQNNAGNNSGQRPFAPQDLFVRSPQGYVLQLDKVASASGRTSPVWRVAISEQYESGSNQDVLRKRNQFNDTISFQPENMRPLDQRLNPNATVDALTIDRYVFFTQGTGNAPSINVDQAFWNRNASANARVTQLGLTALPTQALLAPGQYAVVGPRLRTHTGVKASPPANTNPSSDQMIDLGLLNHMDPAANRFPFKNVQNGNAAGLASINDVQKPLVILAGAERPQNWPQANANDPEIPFIGVNISEPLPGGSYYDPPTHLYEDLDQDFLLNNEFSNVYFNDAYYNENNPGNSSGYPDRPMDDNPAYNSPIRENMQGTGTYENVRSAFLQRLANPLAPWNPPRFLPDGTADNAHDPMLPVNPYITVDWSPMDLTVFNGQHDARDWDDEDQQAAGDFDPQDPGGENAMDALAFRSRRRGVENNTDEANLYAQRWRSPNQGGATTPSGNDYVGKSIEHRLGFLHEEIAERYLPADFASAVNRNKYKGSPKVPFPWLTWNDRPFATPHEVMLVPSSAPNRLLHEYIYNSGGGLNAYASDTGQENNISQPDGYLLNFFMRPKAFSQQPPPDVEKRALFHRLFDFVETPSPYVGTRLWYRPSSASNQANSYANFYRPPHNYLTRFRDPGRINLNTIFERDVWVGLTNAYPDLRELWPDPAVDPVSLFIDSRRGYTATEIGDSNARFPTAFANPFRAASSADMRPDVENMRSFDPSGGGNSSNSIPATVEATLLRPEQPTGSDPLFRMGDGPGPIHADRQRNPYFRLQGVDRMPNLVTTHSNVYAIWITVGFFEVEEWRGGNPNGPQVFDEAHPDGFQLGQEVGSLSGEIKRHRAFYLIDRSIPVAFEPGENHNVDRAILIRRFIE